MKALLPFLTLFKKQWLMMGLGLLLSLITLAAGIGLLSLSGWFLSASAVAGITIVTSQAFNFYTPAAGVRFFSIVRTVSRYGERLATHEATFKLLTQLRVWVWNKLLPLSAKNRQGLRNADLLNRLVADIDTLDHLYLRLMVPLLASLLMLLGLYCFMAWFDHRLALIVCGFLLATWLLLPLIFYRLGREPGIAQVETKRELRIQLLSYLQGQAELTLFGAQQQFRQALELAELALFSSQRAMSRVTALSQALVVVCHGFAMILMLYMAATGVGTAVPPGPKLAMMVFMTMATIEMMMPIAGAFQHLSACTISAVRLNEVVDQAPDITFPAQSSLSATKGAIEIQDVSFSYDGKTEVLNRLNLSIKAGSHVALLGQTGCGKSSLLALITRQWQFDRGQITLDGHAIMSYSEANLTASMSVISQRVYLFSGSVRDNLMIALPAISKDLPLAERKKQRKINDTKLTQVLEKVGLHTLLQGDKPLDAFVGEGGRQLSGGELRRIGVARALLRQAPLLLLDEPTEGLDKRTEREILALLFEFAKDRTMLMISHRLTAMSLMDEIHLMEAGKIRSSGTHTALLESDDYYQRLNQRLV